jgi:hypothetical protein
MSDWKHSILFIIDSGGRGNKTKLRLKQKLLTLCFEAAYAHGVGWQLQQQPMQKTKEVTKTAADIFTVFPFLSLILTVLPSF